jgi:hypothetical protein
MFLHVVGHNQRFRVIEMTFRRFGETSNRYFQEVLYVVGQLHNKIIVICDESSRSPTMAEADDEQPVKCALVLTQSWQVLDDDGIADESAFDGSNEVVYDMEPPSGSVHDVVDEAGMMIEVGP